MAENSIDLNIRTLTSNLGEDLGIAIAKCICDMIKDSRDGDHPVDLDVMKTLLEIYISVGRQCA